MSGDVQPRKRKDKKRKKDELGLEEPRGTAAVFGEGDVFMHSQHDHGTGGHWCAKIIFFSLLAILVTLIGLIILENRGLSELEANAVESRYSGVLEGWLEDAPDDDHHDVHTLELNHHDDDEDHEDHMGDDDQNEEVEQEDEDEHSDLGDDDDEQLDRDDDQDDDEDEPLSNEDDDENNEEDADNEEEDQYNNDSRDQELEDAEEDDEEPNQEPYEEDDEDENDSQADEDNNYDDLEEIDGNDDNSNADADNEDEHDNNSNEISTNESDENIEENDNQDDEDDDEHEEEDENDEEVEIEKLEKELSEEEQEPISTELPALPEDDDDDDDEKEDQDQSDEKDAEPDEDSGIDDEEEEFLDDDTDEPPVERITAPAGSPLIEVEDEVSSEQPPDTLEEEEEYEKRQEELRREEAQASHMWLKLGVGAALLVATHAVMRRATRSRDAPETEEHASREETPVIDRRLTLIPEEPPARKFGQQEISRPVIEKQALEKVAPIVQSIPFKKQESEEEEEEKQLSEDEEEGFIVKKADDKELYSEEEDEEVEEEEEEEIVLPKKEIPKQAPVVAKKPEPKPEPEPEEEEDDEDPEDVEIIGDEQLEEELEEEGDEEEISDVDDTELLSRLEAKYGRLPEPDRPGQKQKDGGNSMEDAWPGEPSDAYWRQQLDSAERELREGSWSAAIERASGAGLRESARARYVLARALDLSAEAGRDNRLLSRAIAAYLDLLKMNERLTDKRLLEVTRRTLDRIQFRGNYLNAEPVYRLLIRRFPNEPAYRNNLTISFLMANRVDLAEEALKETLQRWPSDRVALAHYGFVLKTKYNKYEEAAKAFEKALEGDSGPANEPRFYYHYGDSLLLLGRHEEAHEVHKRGAKLGHFLSPSQRSLYNVDRLKSTPWWDIEKTPYLRLAKALEKSWKAILKEGEAAKALYEKEKEGLKERGEWSQLDLFVRGQEIPGRCQRAPVTCSVVKSEPAAAGCRRGQVKFSAMAAGTHVRAHVGPTNCRLRMHLGLSNTKDTYLRVDKETRQWQEGKVLMFDDSFEHEVWHNGTGSRLVLIVDVWHPHLTAIERRQLPAI